MGHDPNLQPKKSRQLAIGIAMVSFFILIIGFRAAGGEESTINSVFFGIFGLVILFFAFSWGRTYYTKRRVGKPEITFSKTAVSVGETFTVDFHNTFNSDVNFENFIIKLIFKETATYQQGTNTRTVYHEEVVEEVNELGGNYSKGSFLSKQVDFKIPNDGMHTLSVKRNSLRWLVKFELDIPKLANFSEEREIQVLPQLVEEAI